MRTSTLGCTCRLFYSSLHKGSKKDFRQDLAKKNLFETPPSPVLQLSSHDGLKHEIIHRAWILRDRKLRIAKQKELSGQYNKMRTDCEVLKSLRSQLYRASMAHSYPETLFPLSMHIPTDTPAPAGWDHDWKREKDTANLIQ